jgi:hypothetical protein
VQIHQPRIDHATGGDAGGVVKPRGGCLALRGHALDDPGVVDVEDTVGDFRTRVVEGHEVTAMHM